MHYPRPPHRPQAYRVRFVGRRRSTRTHGVSTWYFCVAALALVATVVGLDTSRRAVAAPDHPELPAPEARAVDGVQPHAWDPMGFPMLLQPTVAHAAPDEASDGGPATPAHTADMRAAATGAPRHAPPVAAPVQAAAAAPARQSRQLYAQLTAYSASVEEGTAWGITRSGTRVRPGVVAVDPAVIPLGSRVRIAGLPGTYVAEDTGGGIRGAHVDVYMPSRAAALQFGYRKSVLVEVLE
jgi:3D (Asp-Asp-Asp) domain-containing protein